MNKFFYKKCYFLLLFFNFLLTEENQFFNFNENLNLKIFLIKRARENSTKKIIASIFGILASGFLFFSKSSTPETQKIGALGAIHSAQNLIEAMIDEEEHVCYRKKNKEQLADLISKIIKNEKLMEIAMKKILELSQKNNLEKEDLMDFLDEIILNY